MLALKSRYRSGSRLLGGNKGGGGRRGGGLVPSRRVAVGREPKRVIFAVCLALLREVSNPWVSEFLLLEDAVDSDGPAKLGAGEKG